MGQQLSRPSSWLDAIKLAWLSTAVGLVQWVRWQVSTSPARALCVVLNIPSVTKQHSSAIANDRDRCLLQLAIAERAEQEAEQLWRHQHGRSSGQRQHQRSREKRGGGLLGSVPPEVRRAALNLIDYQLTPVLVDQWRYVLLFSALVRRSSGSR